MNLQIAIRSETAADIPGIHAVNASAFPTADEANLVDGLREIAEPFLSLVAEVDGAVVGHILFTPVHLDANPALPGMGLAPMAVLPEYQNQGIGSALVRAGLERLRAQGCPFVIVLGHEHYYPRFGFAPASRYSVQPTWEGVSDAVFMLLPLDPQALHGISGIVRYHPLFDTVT